MAVGVIISGAFGKIVTSFVNDILMPLIGVIIGGHDFSSLSIKANRIIRWYLYAEPIKRGDKMIRLGKGEVFLKPHRTYF